MRTANAEIWFYCLCAMGGAFYFTGPASAIFLITFVLLLAVIIHRSIAVKNASRIYRDE